MADPSSYLTRLTKLRDSLKWEDDSLSEMSERLRLLGLLYEVADTIDFFEEATEEANETIIIRKINDVDFEYWTNINNWDIPDWLTHEDCKKSYLNIEWNIKSNREYISEKLANDISGYLAPSPEIYTHNDEEARTGIRDFLHLYQGVYFNVRQLQYAVLQAIKALIQTLINLEVALAQERTDEEYEAWYNELRMEFSIKLISEISKNYASICNQRMTEPSRDWLLERLGDAAADFWKTPFMQARKNACTNQECVNQKIYFNIPDLSKEQQRKFFHALWEFGTFSDNGYQIDKPAQVARCFYRLFIVNAHEQAIEDFFNFQIITQIISSDLARCPSSTSIPIAKKKSVQIDKTYMTFCMGDINIGHINLLRQKMVEFGWIPEDTKPDAFSNLFNGEANKTKIVWTGKVGKGTLAFLFKKMKEQHKISVPKSYRINPILEAHFVDTEGNYLTGLHKGEATGKLLPLVQQCLDVLYYTLDFD